MKVRECLMQFWNIGIFFGGALAAVATSDVTETGEVDVIRPLVIARAGGSPAVGLTKADGVGRIVLGVDDRGVRGLLVKVLKGTLIGTGRLAVDLDHVATEKGCDPVVWPGGECDTTGDANVGAGVVNGELASGDGFAVVAADLGPLEDVVAIGDPGRNLHVLAFAFLGAQKIVATRLLCSLQYRVCGKVVYSGFFCLRYFELKFDPNRPSLDDAVGSLLGCRAVLAAYRYPPKSAGAWRNHRF
jgi:hypothetical protein